MVSTLLHQLRVIGRGADHELNNQVKSQLQGYKQRGKRSNRESWWDRGEGERVQAYRNEQIVYRKQSKAKMLPVLVGVNAEAMQQHLLSTTLHTM